MTKKEKNICFNLYNVAKQHKKWADENYKKFENYSQNSNNLKAETIQRAADQDTGYYEGILFVLESLGFKEVTK